MKKIVLGSAFLALSAFSTGCIISSGDDGSGSGVDDPQGLIDVSWKIRTTASQADLGCPTGVTTVAFHVQPVDDNNNDTGSEQIDLFNCTDGHGTAGETDVDAPDALPFGFYRTFAVFSSTGGAQKYAETPQWPDGLADDEREDIADASTPAHASKSYDVFTDGGYFSLGWSFAGGATCTSAQSDGVSAIATVSGGSAAADEVFHCTAGFGISGGYGAGNYTAAVTALDGNVGIGTPKTKTFSIATQNAVTDLGDVVLDAN
ncbi:MAG TPA: hypothetical protein VGM90_01350 [Kofleriaceae bacterium]|jgi:hypothetical protein